VVCGIPEVPEEYLPAGLALSDLTFATSILGIALVTKSKAVQIVFLLYIPVLLWHVARALHIPTWQAYALINNGLGTLQLMVVGYGGARSLMHRCHGWMLSNVGRLRDPYLRRAGPR
jgi:hypothetical protein